MTPLNRALEPSSNMTRKGHFKKEQGIFVPRRRLYHRSEAYDEAEFDVLLRMQRRHFWYRGRHRLLLKVFRKEISRRFGSPGGLQAIDMGGGVGGWLEYLQARGAGMCGRLALGDSSMRALSLAGPVVGSFAARYQIDLSDLPWQEEWDVVFLLDVLEHIPDDREVLRQVRRSLRPGGLLFVTTPALRFFWTYNDDLTRHQRRYCKQDFRVLGESVGLEVLRTDYFMFLLSPALLLSRLLSPPAASATPEQLRDHVARTHRIPPRLINEALAKIFSLEASMVNHLAFPWGTSILALFQR